MTVFLSRCARVLITPCFARLPGALASLPCTVVCYFSSRPSFSAALWLIVSWPTSGSRCYIYCSPAVQAFVFEAHCLLVCFFTSCDVLACFPQLLRFWSCAWSQDLLFLMCMRACTFAWRRGSSTRPQFNLFLVKIVVCFLLLLSLC